jgi:hypothetical protein
MKDGTKVKKGIENRRIKVNTTARRREKKEKAEVG